MPGVPGKGGPVPKRSDQRRRRNKPDQEIASAAATSTSDIPAADEDWHPIARDWYESLVKSGQAHFYEPSDWATARLIAESISRDLKPQPIGVHPETGEAVTASIPMKGASLAAYLKAMTALLVTEGDRRRSRVELERSGQVDADEDAAVAKLDEYRRRITP